MKGSDGADENSGRVMRIFTDMEALPAFREPVVTVGSFDGVHRGHAHLLGIMRERARLAGGETVVVTFARHPRKVLDAASEFVLLTSLEERALLLEREGVDNLVVMPFDEATSRLGPEEFVRDFLVGRLGVRELVVGYNHRFGRNRDGDAATLEGLGEKYGFGIYRASRLGDSDEKISSTAIRQALARGDVEAAERMLGRKPD